MEMALSHIKVLDLTSNLSGPYCAMLLADQGADVIKIERPDVGDDMRVTPPFVGEQSAPFMIWNRNKRSMILDLKSKEGLENFKRLAMDADVIVENYKPGTADRIGIGYKAIKAINPQIIYCSISGFGQTGPYAPRGGFDLISQSMTAFVFGSLLSKKVRGVQILSPTEIQAILLGGREMRELRQESTLVLVKLKSGLNIQSIAGEGFPVNPLAALTRYYLKVSELAH